MSDANGAKVKAREDADYKKFRQVLDRGLPNNLETLDYKTGVFKFEFYGYQYSLQVKQGDVSENCLPNLISHFDTILQEPA